MIHLSNSLSDYQSKTFTGCEIDLCDNENQNTADVAVAPATTSVNPTMPLNAGKVVMITSLTS